MYIGTQPYQGFRARHTYTATAGQTSFSGAGAENVTLTYSDEMYIDVYQNGVKLSPADYTATSGTTVVLAQGASVSDIVEVVKYDAFSVADTVSAKDGGTQFGLFGNESSDFLIQSSIQDKDIIFQGNDGGSGIEAARFDMSLAGMFLLGKTSSAAANKGVELHNTGSIVATVDGGTIMFLNRKTSDGSIIEFRKDNSAIGSIGTANSGDLYINNDDVSLMMAGGSDAVIPRGTAGALRDAVIDLGVSSNRFDNIFAANDTINTSDKNEKQDIEELTDAEKKVAIVCKGLMRKYRWKKAVTEKGDNARTHFGIIAQELEDAFKAEGLDASKYALFCSDTWWEANEKYTDADGKEQTRLMDYHSKEEAPEDATKITRLGVRYSELLAFIISAI